MRDKEKNAQKHTERNVRERDGKARQTGSATQT